MYCWECKSALLTEDSFDNSSINFNNLSLTFNGILWYSSLWRTLGTIIFTISIVHTQQLLVNKLHKHNQINAGPTSQILNMNYLWNPEDRTTKDQFPGFATYTSRTLWKQNFLKKLAHLLEYVRRIIRSYHNITLWKKLYRHN